MYAIALRAPQFGRYLPLLAAMYQLRRRVFKDRLGWSVSVSGELELDLYDTLGRIPAAAATLCNSAAFLRM
ncbi:acyl-homoserine-lactone synthase [Bradyrhizobium sp. STM 3562]|uniref:acyl-homoserine-lactone synthase n=1 Tax=Bradyrhizobium sp. STM 3562 TaxID=578924 RepID=UPI00388D61FA